MGFQLLPLSIRQPPLRFRILYKFWYQDSIPQDSRLELGLWKKPAGAALQGPLVALAARASCRQKRGMWILPPGCRPSWHERAAPAL